MPAVNNRISFNYEKKLLARGYRIIAGVDEAGRGALAGPLVVGLAIYGISIIKNAPDEILLKIKDSKQLSPVRRTEALKIIQYHSIYLDTAVISHDLVDRLNINSATEYAIKQLLNKALPVPDFVILDGNFNFNLSIPFLSIVRGDSQSVTIASASIAAKVKRDSIMKDYDLQYPGYSFFKNMGYGTREHCEEIRRSGPCAIHRKTYEPVKGILKNVSCYPQTL